MYPFFMELELIKPVSDYLKNQGYKVFHEIKIGYCRADLVGFKQDEVVAVELKLRDWKKAIKQAKNYQLGADYVYLAFPLNKSFNVLKKAEHILRKEKIGLIVIEETYCDVRMIIKAEPSCRKFCSITMPEIKRNCRRYQNKKYKKNNEYF
jgi:hypothetical protein